MTFRNALSLSITVHLSVFLTAAAVVSLLVAQDAGADLKTLEFVFMPAQADELPELESAAQQTEPQQGAAQDMPSLPAPAAEDASGSDAEQAPRNSPVPELNDQPTPATPLTASTPDRHKTTRRQEPNPLQIDDLVSPWRSTYLYSPQATNTPTDKQFKQRQVKLSAASIAISDNERRHLLKRLKKITDDFRLPPRVDTSFTWEHKQTRYTIQMKHTPAASETSLDQLAVKIDKNSDGQSYSTALTMRRMAFSHYAKFVNYWDPRIAVHDDMFDGRFHSNSEFKISQGWRIKPEFRGKVTTAAHRVSAAGDFSISKSDSMFRQGIETGSGAIRFPKHLVPKGAAAAELPLVLEQEAWLTFHDDGRLSWSFHKSATDPQERQLVAAVLNIIGGSKAKLHVRGVLNGRVLIYALNSVYIDDDIRYHRHPEANADARDYLGIVSERNIEIAAHDRTGPGDLVVHGALFARKRFRVKRFYKGTGKDKLYIYGSLTAGTVGATEPRYATRIRFDRRLENKRPAGFPMTSRYELNQWQERWQSKAQ